MSRASSSDEASDVEETLELPSAQRTMTDLAPVHPDEVLPTPVEAALAEPDPTPREATSLALETERLPALASPVDPSGGFHPSSIAPVALDLARRDALERLADEDELDVLDVLEPEEIDYAPKRRLREPLAETFQVYRRPQPEPLALYAALGALAACLLAAIVIVLVVGRPPSTIIDARGIRAARSAEIDEATTSAFETDATDTKAAREPVVVYAAPAPAVPALPATPSLAPSPATPPPAIAATPMMTAPSPGRTGVLRVPGTAPVVVDGWPRHPARDGALIVTCGRHIVKSGARTRTIDVPCGATVAF